MSSSETSGDFWKKCNICKKQIPYGSTYYLCSVSTCKRKRTGFSFCSERCWDAHLGFVSHRTSYCEEATAPTREESRHSSDDDASVEEVERPKRRIIVDDTKAPVASAPRMTQKHSVDTLVVVSKVKQFVKSVAGFNTSQCAIDALTQKVVGECLQGIERAKESERKTLMGRDII